MQIFRDGALKMGKFYTLTVLWFRLQLTHQTTEPVKSSMTVTQKVMQHWRY